MQSIDHNSSGHEFSGGQLGTSSPSDIVIQEMNLSDTHQLSDAIRRSVSDYREAGTVLASTFRRIENFEPVYQASGSMFVVAKDRLSGQCVGGAGIGPLHGLSPEEGLGEIRDLYVDPTFRGQGIGARLLKRCLTEAQNMGYERLYLETTPQMEHAQKLFIRNGFRPVTAGQARFGQGSDMPCYFILENLRALSF